MGGEICESLGTFYQAFYPSVLSLKRKRHVAMPLTVLAPNATPTWSNPSDGACHKSPYAVVQ